MYVAFLGKRNKQHKRSAVARKLKERYERCFSRLKCNKIGATNGITSQAAKKRKNYVFRSKKTTNKVSPKMITGLKVRKRYD